MVYPSSLVWAEDALWVTKGQSTLKIKNGNVVEKGEHSTVVKAMCLCSATDQIVTLGEDGAIRAWEERTGKEVWERDSDFSRKNIGWHGLAISPFALEQVSGVYDQMYKSRNATGKLWAVPTGDTTPIVESILSQVERGNDGSIWDLVDLLGKERDTNLLVNITYALQNYYNKERQPQEPKPHIQALCIANVLYETAKYVEDKVMQENIEQRLQTNITQVLSTYIQTVFQNFKVAEKQGGDDFVLQLTNREILSLKNMFLWIQSFAPELKSASAAIEKHVSHTSISEVCPYCKEPVPFTSHASDTCSTGHFLLRCTRTFLALGTHVLWHNAFTSTKSLIFNFEREDVPHTKEFTWLSGKITTTTHPRCPLYNIPFVRFPPSLLDKIEKEKEINTN